MFGNVFRRIDALPLWAKVLLVVAALIVLGLSVALSPLVAVVALLVLIVAVIALIFRILRRRPLRSWAIIALVSLLLVIVYGGIAGAILSGAPQQASSPSEPKEEAEQEAPVEEAEQEAAVEEIIDAPKKAADSLVSSASSEPTEEEVQDENDQGGYDATARVTRVVDGDTIRISPAVDGNSEVRLIGVDTPETKEPGCEVQPYGPEASEFTTRELQGEEVDLEFDEEREDRYDRLLAYVHKDGDMFNETLLEEGYAQVYTVPPNDKYVDRFEEAQAEAQAAERGIWALSAAEQSELTDRGNGMGGSGCTQKAQPQEKPQPEAPPKQQPQVPESPPPQPQPKPTPAVPKGDVDCGDFSTKAEAQPYLLPGDPHKLDRDNDAVACDSLP